MSKSFIIQIKLTIQLNICLIAIMSYLILNLIKKIILLKY
jgi:hypothetical protein